MLFYINLTDLYKNRSPVNRDIINIIIQNYPDFIDYINDKLENDKFEKDNIINDKKYTIKLIIYKNFYKLLTKELKNDKEFTIKLINTNIVDFLYHNWINDLDVISLLIKKNGILMLKY